MTNHIQAIHEPLLSFCGENIGNEFYFKTVEQAVLNGLHESKLSTCDKCTDKIINYLLKRKAQNNTNLTLIER